MRVRPEVFELRVERRDYDSISILSWHSHVYRVHYNIQLRDRWGDPRPLADYIEHLVGRTYQAWYDARVDPVAGEEMARAVMPTMEREIFRYMERLEYEGRRRREPPRYYDEMARIRPDQWDALRYGIFDDWRGPKEDPKAKEKARQLLMRNLDDGQLKSFKKDGSFRVTAKDGKVYTVKTARSFNVEGPDGARYCGQLADTPVEDQMLAQKLLLQSDPEAFFKNANVSPARGADVGFTQSGTGVTATAINQRYNEMVDMVRLRPGAIVPWDSSI
jgi:hypothetical protein